jgi:MFS family permease
LRGAISIVTILLLVRVVSSFLTRRFHLDAVRKDFYVSQGSAAVTVAGFFVISVAPNPVVLIMGVVLVSLGVPFVVAVLSVATSLVLPDHVATLYSAVSMMRGVGILVAGPLFAGLYAFGMRLGVEWSGLPFAAASLVFCLALVAFSCVQIERRPVSVAGEH